MYPDGLLPRRAPEGLNLFPLAGGVQTIPFCFASRQLLGKGLDVVAIDRYCRSRDAVYGED